MLLYIRREKAYIGKTRDLNNLAPAAHVHSSFRSRTYASIGSGYSAGKDEMKVERHMDIYREGFYLRRFFLSLVIGVYEIFSLLRIS